MTVHDSVVPNIALADFIASLADNKQFLGRRYAEWCTSAPSLESAVAAAAMAQDEIGHARSLYPMLADISGDSPENEPETRTHFTHAQFLNTQFTSWTEFVSANFLFDTALSVGLEAAFESIHVGLAQRARRILEEEKLHWLYAEGWLRRLSSRGGAVQQDLQERLVIITPFAMAWFDLATLELVEDGILSRGSEDLRARFRLRVNPLLDVAGLHPL